MTEYAKLVVAVDSTQVNKGDQALGNFEKAARRTEKSVSSLGSVVRSVAAPLAAFLSVRAVIRASDEYGQMASRIRNATSSTEEYETVQARLLETANGTYRALSEAQEVYLATADTLRDLGYATSEVLDITDSFSHALVRDAARADQATSAMDAYSKSLMKGKIDADAWASIMAATPSIVNGISEATGRSTEEIRKLGATGKLSVEALNEGLRRSREENKALADAMETSVQDALINLQTQFGVFVGKVNETSGASGVLVESLEEMAQILADPATIEAAQQLAAGVVTAFSGIASSMRETVGIVKWGAEELAAWMGGIAADDVVRLNDELVRLQKMKEGGALDKLVFFGRDGMVSYYNEQELDAEIAKIQAAINDAMNRPGVNAPSPGVTGEGRSSGLAGAKSLVSATSGSGDVDKATQAIDRQISALQLQASTLGMTSNAVTLYKLAQEGATETQLKQADAALRAVSAYEKQTEAVRLMNEQEERTNTEASSILDSLMTEEERIRESYERRRQIIMDATLLTEEQKNEAVMALKLEHDEQMLLANGSYWEQYMIAAQDNLLAFDELSGVMLENFTGRFGDAFESMVFEAESFGDALQGLGESMARSVISAIGEMAAQWAAYQALEMAGIAKTTAAKTASISTITTAQMGSIAATTAASTAATATTTATQAAAAATTAAAWTPAAIVASIGSFGGAAAIGLAAVIAALAFTGGFRKGGYTGNGGVNDVAGVVHGKEYVFDAASTARIGVANLEAIRNGEMPAEMTMVRQNASSSGSAQAASGAGGTSINVNLIEDASKAGQVEQVRGEDGMQALNVWVARIRAGGNAESAALEQAYGLSRVGR
ncbi:tape measure protein [Stutzerimonas nitrititolerans]|uniref:tape measure protein n=1 Tax=Stutzerimonas nitrititolerans TaxID=2482751 RepID=UPI0028AAF2B8|nr:tape measure protein [Stutzerimonas nitrititolerans]